MGEKVSDICRCLLLWADLRQAYCWIFLFLQTSSRVIYFLDLLAPDFLVKPLHVSKYQASLGILALHIND